MLIKIIPAKPRHLKQIRELNKLLYLPELEEIKPFIWSEIAWIENSLEKFFVAEMEGAVVGAFSLDAGHDSEAMELVSIAVSTEHQGKGIGKKLISFAKNFAIMCGANKLTLATFDSYKKVEFYKSQGFREKGVFYYYAQKFGNKFLYHRMEANLY
jgi:ribosomal protein S18 acetylase RimI-like enzyme